MTNCSGFADGTKMHAEGDWHEIRVATATAEDAEGNLLARQSRARFLPVEQVGWVLLLLARDIGYQNARLRAFVADGAPWLWNIAKQLFGSAVQILDWYHLAEHVHKAANTLFDEGTSEAKDWAKRLKDALWEGQIGEALAAIEAERKRLRSSAKREALAELERYLENNRDRLDYPTYRALGVAGRERTGGSPVQDLGGGALQAGRHAQLDLCRGRRCPAYAGCRSRRHLPPALAEPPAARRLIQILPRNGSCTRCRSFSQW